MKTPEQTWQAAFKQFLGHANERIKFILSGIQYFHDCETAASQSHVKEDFFSVKESGHRNADYEVKVELGEGISEGSQSGYTEEGLVALIASQTSIQEELHGHLAV